MKKEFSGYYFRNLLKQARRRNNLIAGEQALYQELVDICNEERWPKNFQAGNMELRVILNCSENTLILWRSNLVKAGLIKYISGKSQRQKGSYELLTTTAATTEETTTVTTEATTTVTTEATTSATTSNIDDNIYKQNTTKPNKTFSKSHSDKSVKKENKITTDHWKKIVDVWFQFYKKNYLIEPTFNGASSKSLKQIVDRIKKLSTEQNYEWTEEYAARCFEAFLSKAIKDQWIAANFLLSNLYSKFDSIVTPKNNGNSKNNHQSATGAAVDTGSLLSKINAMPD